MNIIFGEDNAKALSEKYIVLELDTFKFPEVDEDMIAYCVVDGMPFDELSSAEENKNRHVALLEGYKAQKWDSCLDGIDDLLGCWGGEMDTYYDNLRERVTAYAENAPADDWTHVIVK